MPDQLAGERERIGNDVGRRVADPEPASEVEHSRRPVELVAAELSHVDETLDGEEALRRPPEL
jgi:hypothetical protein